MVISAQTLDELSLDGLGLTVLRHMRRAEARVHTYVRSTHNTVADEPHARLEIERKTTGTGFAGKVELLELQR
jgi:hypothetical protein